MYKKTKPTKTTLIVNQSLEGETLEQKIRRIVNNKEPIHDGAPLIYTERKNGVEPQYDIRTDRFEIAVEAMDKVSGTHTAKRDQRLGEQAKEGMKKEEISEAKPIQGTDAKDTSKGQ